MTAPRRAGAKKRPASSRFPENLRALRGDRSQTEFAEWLLVSQQTLSFWEQGKRRPNRRTWAVLEQRLGFSQAQLELEHLFVSGASGVAEGFSIGHAITLPPLRGAVALRLGLQGLSAEAMGMADIQRALREALRGKRPVWLVVG